MGSIFSKAPPAVKPRDDSRVEAASQHVAPIHDDLMALGKKIQGKVLLPDGNDSEQQEAYHMQRERTFFFNDANYPGAIIVVESVNDVAEVIKMVGKLNADKYVLCIAGGCHSHYCMVDNSIVMDLEKLNQVSVDKDAKTMTVEGGAKIKAAHEALKGTGYSFMTGTNEDTGVSGLTLAGGAGYLGGQAGFSCDTVLSAKVVLPSGEIVVATDDNKYSDLMRALRGGGGNFGVVVEWTFKLFDVTNTFGGTVVHFAPTMARLKMVLDSYAQVLEDIPDEGSSICALPAGAPVFVTVATVIGGDQAKSAESYQDIPFLAKVSQLGAWFRLENTLGRKDYIEEIAPILEPVQQRCYAVALGAMVYSFDEALRDALIHFARVDYPGKNTKGTILAQRLNGEMQRNDGSKSSLPHRKAIAWIIIEAGYEPEATPEQIQSVKDWATRLKTKVLELGGQDGPHNFCDTDGRRINFFTKEQKAFLEKAKKKYDPKNLFTLNKNIKYYE